MGVAAEYFLQNVQRSVRTQRKQALRVAVIITCVVKCASIADLVGEV